MKRRIVYIKGEDRRIEGLMLLPDDWTMYDEYLASDEYTEEEWSKMEANGAVFLPAAGCRFGTGVYDVGSNGYYWSASPNSSNNGHNLNFNSSNWNWNNNKCFIYLNGVAWLNRRVQRQQLWSLCGHYTHEPYEKRSGQKWIS